MLWPRVKKTYFILKYVKIRLSLSLSDIYSQQDQLTLFLIETGNRSGRDVDFFAKLGLSHIEQVNKLMNNGPGQRRVVCR
jgi:hypothetical protein